jgi:TP901 family phage tail tape measure protein
MVNSTSQVDVVLEANGQGVSNAMDSVLAKIRDINIAINKANQSASKGAVNFDVAMKKTLVDLKSTLGALNTLQKGLTANGPGQANSAEALGNATAKAARFTRAMKDAGSATQIVETRLAAINKLQTANIGGDTKLANKYLKMAENIKMAEKELRQLDALIKRTDASARQKPGSYSTQQSGVLAARQALVARLQSPRSSDFGPELKQLTDQAAAYKNIVASTLTTEQQVRITKAQQVALTRELNAAGALALKVGKEDLANTITATNADAQRLAGQGRLYDLRQRLVMASAEETNQILRDIQLEKERIRLANELLRIQKAQAEKPITAAQQTAVTRAALPSKFNSTTSDTVLSRELEASKIRLLSLQSRIEAVKGRERLTDLNSIAIEKAKIALIEKEVALRAKAAAAAAAPVSVSPAAAPKTGAQYIMSGEYLLAAAARTTVYGAAAAAVYSVATAASEAVGFVVQFEDGLGRLAAIAGATDQQMQGVAKNILEVGANSRYSVIELTEAATTLAQAGFSVKDLEDSLGAVSRLATASGSSPAEAVDLITAAIGSFQLQAGEASRVADILVAALNRSRLGVEQVSKAIQYVGATAFENNISLEQLVATAGALANAGIKSGSTIGTGLRQFLVDLQDPSEKLIDQLGRVGLTMQDVDVKTVGLRGALENLKNAGFGASQAYGALETRAAANYLVLKNNLDVIDDLTLAEAQRGQAIIAEAKAMETLSGQWQRFKNLVAQSFDDVSFGPVKDFLKDMNNELERRQTIEETLMATLTKRAGESLTQVEILRKEAAAAKEAGDFVGLLSAKIKLLSEYYYLNGLEAFGWQSSTEDAATAVANASDEVATQTQKIDTLNHSIDTLIVQQKTLQGDTDQTAIATASLASQFEGLSSFLAKNTQDIYGVIKALQDYRAEAQGVLVDVLNVQNLAFRGQRDTARIAVGQDAAAVTNSDLSPKDQRAVVAALKGDRNYAGSALADIANRQPKGSTSRRLVTQLATNFSEFNIANQNVVSSERRASVAEFDNGRNGRRIADSRDVLRGTGSMNESASRGQSLAERQSISASEVKRLDPAIAALEKSLENKNLDYGARESLSKTLLETRSLRTAALGRAIPTKAETTAANKKPPRTRQNNKPERDALSVAKTTFKTSDLELSALLKQYKKPGDTETLLEGADEIDVALENWTTDKLALIKAEIDKQKLTGDDATNYLREGKEQIQLKVEEVRESIMSGVVATLEGMTKAADQAFEARNFNIQIQSQMLEAQAAGLNNQSLKNKVPEFVRVNLEDRIGAQNEQNDQAQVASNLLRIQDYASSIVKITDTIKALEAKSGLIEGDAGFAGMAGAEQNIEKLTGNIVALAATTDKFSAQDMTALKEILAEVTQKMRELGIETDGLNLKLGAAALLPQSFGEAFQGAAQAYASVNGLNNTFSENLQNNLMPAIGEVHGAFSTFFQDMITKPQEVLANFANFARGILEMVQKLAAQLLAQQIFGALLQMAMSLAGGSGNMLAGTGAPATGSGGGGHGDFRFSPGNPLGFYKGGKIPGYASGGKVNHGVPQRDSVLTALARGEYVVRKSAVDSVGEEFLNDVNQKGARALRGMAPVQMPQSSGPEQKMNVYVVAPEERPSMGPNDVIAIISRDILKDGNTKRLIKHIAQGG